MTQLLEPADLKRPEIVRAQWREWRAERVGWLVMSLILLAGLLGFFGDGPLAHRRTRAGALTLDYDAMVRSNASSHLALAITSTGDRAPLRIWLRQGYMATVQLQHIVPQPVRSFSEAGRLVMDFAAAPGGGRYLITVEIEPNRIGSHHAVVGVASDSIRFQQFVFP